jgi:hypothetical protein
MILVSMLPNEIYDTIAKDYRKLEIRIDKYLPKAINSFKKAITFPVWYVDEYDIPETRNKHITFYYASNPSEISKPRYLTFSIASDDNQRYIIRAIDMPYKQTPDSKPIMLPQIHSYTSHFLKRYNERFLHKKDITANEIAGLFFINNRKPFIIELNEDIKKSFKEYGEFNTHGIKADGGFCFARTAIHHNKINVDKEETMLIIYTTFVSNNEMSVIQKKAIDDVCNETLMRCLSEFIE